VRHAQLVLTLTETHGADECVWSASLSEITTRALLGLIVLITVGVGGLPEAFVGSGGLLGLKALDLLEERLDAHVVLIAVLLFPFLVMVLMLPLALALKLC
jgi:hypothetical protein